MTVLSKKARHFIESGVRLLPDDKARATWAEWARSHPIPKGSFLTQEDEPFPSEVLDAAISALSTEIRNYGDVLRCRIFRPGAAL